MSHTRETNNHSDIIIDYIFAFQVAMDIMRNDEDQKPQTVDECQKMNDWPKWKEAIQNRAKVVTKTRGIWTYSAYTWKHKAL